MIKLVGIHKIYQDQNFGFMALKDINLDFKDDHFVCILGKSGSGKTTLLNIIGGLDTPSSGHMVINGELTTKFTEAQWDYFRNYKIGFVFQNYSLIEHLTVLDNVKLAIKIQGIKDDEAKTRALEMLDKVGIKSHAHKLPKQLSGGERQRVAIARALVNNPELILADEPTGNLDKKNSEQIMKLLKEISNEYLVIMVTHSKKMAKKYADRIIELEDGMVSSDTKPSTNEKVLITKPVIKHTRFRFIDKIKHAFKNIRMKKWRSFLVSFGLAIGVSSFILLNGISNGIKVNLKNSIVNKALNPDLYINVDKRFYNENDINNYLEKLHRNKDILAARYYYPKYFQIINFKDRDIKLSSQMTYKFVDESNSYLLGNPYKDGRWPEKDDEIMLSYNFLSSLYDLTDIDLMWNKVKNGKITIAFEHYYEPVEIFYFNQIVEKYPFIDEETVPEGYDFGRFGDFSYQINKQMELYGKLAIRDDYIYVCADYNVLQEYEISDRVKKSMEFTVVGVNEFKHIDELIITKNVYFDASLNDGNYNNEFQIYLTDKGKENIFEVKNKLSEDGWVRDVLKNNEPIFLIDIFIGIATFIISMILVVSVVTAGLMLLMLLLISIIERSREIGILRSLGATKSDILSVFVSESAVIGFLAGIIGIILSILLMIFGNMFIKYKYKEILIDLFYNDKVNLIKITPLSCIIACVVCTILAVLFGLFPAIKASKKTPINALKRL